MSRVRRPTNPTFAVTVLAARDRRRKREELNSKSSPAVRLELSAAFSAVAVVSVLALFATIVPASSATAAGLHDHRVRFLYDIGRQVQWPQALSPHNRSFVIGVIGDETAVDAVRALEGRKMAGSPIVVRVFDQPTDITFCHLLYVATRDGKTQSDVIKLTTGSGVVTVGESFEFARVGGIVGLVDYRRQVGVAINLRAARLSNLVFDSDLLDLSNVYM